MNSDLKVEFVDFLLIFCGIPVESSVGCLGTGSQRAPWKYTEAGTSGLQKQKVIEMPLFCVRFCESGRHGTGMSHTRRQTDLAVWSFPWERKALTLSILCVSLSNSLARRFSLSLSIEHISLLWFLASFSLCFFRCFFRFSSFFLCLFAMLPGPVQVRKLCPESAKRRGSCSFNNSKKLNVQDVICT